MPSVEPGLVRCSFVDCLRIGRCDSGSTNCRHGRHLRQPEIQNLGVPALGDEDVGGLDVAVNDSLAQWAASSASAISMRQSEQHVPISSGLPRDPVPQRQPVQKLHGDEGLVHRASPIS